MDSFVLTDQLSPLEALKLVCEGGLLNVPFQLQELLIEQADVFSNAEAEGEQVYGLTRGVGYGRRTIILGSARPELSDRLLSYGVNHTDQILSTSVSRGALLLRSRSLSVGQSGVSLAVLESMVNWFNNQVSPVLYRSGSIGAADLGEMGQLARCLLGYPGSQVRPSLDGSMEEASQYSTLSTEDLSSRDPLGLVSSNAVTVSSALLLLGEASAAFDFALRSFAVSLVAFKGNPSPFSPGVLENKVNSCERRASGRLYDLYNINPQQVAPRDVQDPLSFRCYGQVMGALLQSLENFSLRLEEHINSSEDNPTIDLRLGEISSTANFDTTLLAAAADELKISFARAGLLTAERINKLSWPEFNESNGAQSGTTYSGMALAGQLRGLTYPASLAFAGQPSRGVEDWAALLPQSVDECRNVLRITCEIWGLEASTAAALLKSEPIKPSGDPYCAEWIERPASA